MAINTGPAHRVDPDIAKIAWNHPIPGQSWAKDPPKSRAWQKPPQFTDLNDAMNFLMTTITNEVHLKELLDLMDAGMSVEAVCRTLLFTGFTLGKWTPSLMMLMHKPTMLALIALAKRAGLDHTPVVHPSLFQKYHLNKLKRSMIRSRVKDQGEMTDVAAQETPPTGEPQPAPQGFFNRQ